MLVGLPRNRHGLQVRGGPGVRAQGTEATTAPPSWVLWRVGQHWAQFLPGQEKGPGFLTVG